MFVRYFSSMLVLLSLCTVSANLSPKMGFQQQLQRGYGVYNPQKGFASPNNIGSRYMNYYQNGGGFGRGGIAMKGGINPGIQSGPMIGKGISPIIGKGISPMIGKGGIATQSRPIGPIGKGIGGPIIQSGGIRPIGPIGKGMVSPILQSGGIRPIGPIGKGFGGPIIQSGGIRPIGSIGKGFGGPIIQSGGIGFQGKGPIIQPGLQRPIIQPGFQRPIGKGFGGPILQNGPIFQNGGRMGGFGGKF